MGVCLSKGGHGHHHHGRMLTLDDEGFCTPEAVSSQYESCNPSGRYSFAHLETPRISADVGDLGALGSLFYKRGSRSREATAPLAPSNYISPLEMFLGGVSGRNRVHHVNQICTGDYSFASYLASPLLKGFDVHAMEAVAKSYAESAAKAAARDAFVFLEENDVSAVSSATFQGSAGEECNKVSTSSTAVGDDFGDVDDDLAKSGDSEEWEEPKGSEDWDEDDKSPHFRTSNEPGTNERWVSVLNAVQARAKARRRQRRKFTLGKAQGKGVGVARKKTVTFQLDELEEGLTDDDIRSGKESECDQASVGMEDVQVVDDFLDSSAPSTAQHPEASVDNCVECLDRSHEDVGVVAEAEPAEEDCHYYNWQDEDEKSSNADAGGNGAEEVVDAEYLGFTFTSLDVVDGGPGPVPGGGATPLVTSASFSGHAHQFSSLDSSSEYFFPEPDFVFSQQQPEEVVMDSGGLRALAGDDNDEAMNFQNRGLDLEVDAEENFRMYDVHGEEEEGGGRLCCPTNSSDEAASFSGGSLGDVGSSRTEQDVESLFVKDISMSNDSEALPPAIPVGCVVVESRLADGSRLTPQILDLSDVQLPERGEDNYGFFRARILCSGNSSPSGSDPNSDQEGSFSFPILFPSPASPSSKSSSRPSRVTRGCVWKDAPRVDPETPIKNRSIRPHSPPPPPPPILSTAIPVREIHEITSQRSPPAPVADNNPSCNSMGTLSSDMEETVTKRTHEIVLPTLPSRSLSPTPVFSPSKLAISSLRSAVASSPFRPPIQVSSTSSYPPKVRRSLNRKLKFYSLERASYAATGGKRSKSPPSFSRQSREQRRDIDGESDSDLFEIETMSGTNAMGSSRTPPSTPTKSSGKMTPPVASFDLDKLSDSIAQVSRSRSKRNQSPITPAPPAQGRNSKIRCLPTERKRDSVFQESGGASVKSLTHNSLKGRALLKLGLLMRSGKHGRIDHSRDSEPYKSSETAVSEYLENKPPMSVTRYPQGLCGQYIVEDDRAPNHNYAFEWYCRSMSQRVAPLHPEKRHQQQQGFSSHKSFSSEDRTFAVKN